MPNKCCVSSCNSNYASSNERTTVFSFPKDIDKSNMWLREIDRDDYKITKSSVVCVKHFEAKYVIREDKATRSDGSVLVVKRKHPKLSDDAVPTIFLNQPDTINDNKIDMQPRNKRKRTKSRKIINIEENDTINDSFDDLTTSDDAVPTICLNQPETISDNQIGSTIDMQSRNKRKRTKSRKIINIEENDTINSFDDLTTNYQSKLQNIDQILDFKIDKIFIIYKMNIDEVPHLTYSIKIDRDLKCEIFFKNVALEDQYLLNRLGTQFICSKWSQLEDVLRHLQSLEFMPTKVGEAYKENSIKSLDLLLTAIDLDPDELKKLKFVRDQLVLLFAEKHIYSVDTLIWTCTMHLTFPDAYFMLRNSNILTLPDQKYLKDVTNKLSLQNSGTDNSHLAYIQNKVKLLDKKDLAINILIDEISVNSGTIQVFMISSLFSNNKDVIGLFPVKNLKSQQLLNLTMDVIQILTKSGYNIISIISDNNRVNRKMFEMLCDGGQIQTNIQNPYNTEQNIFILYDSAHLLKSIRNDWFDQTDVKQTIFFSDINSDSVTIQSYACVNNMKMLYASEKDKVVKAAPTLTTKVLYPASVERQNVNLCVKVFDQKNVTALKLTGKAEGTVRFLEIITNWWNVMNCKSLCAGVHKKHNFMCPITSMDDEKLLFLKKMLRWLEQWNDLAIEGEINSKKNKRKGKLSNETHLALTQTIKATLDLCQYLFEKLGVKNILMGKFQTDDLETKFGQMIGANCHHISMQQILESERKLKLLNLINMKSFSGGDFQLKDFINAEATENSTVLDIESDELFQRIMEDFDQEVLSVNENMVLIYISGYITHKICLTSNCDECISILQYNKKIEIDCTDKTVFECFQLIDQGGLKYPKEDIVNSIVIQYVLFKILITEKYESKFLKAPSQKNYLVNVTSKLIQNTSALFDRVCFSCGTSYGVRANKCLQIFSDILLNNYRKRMNDEANKWFKLRKFRKLSGNCSKS